MADENLLTRYFIFVPTDETRRTWEYVASVVARDRQHAGTLHFGPTSKLEEPVHFTAVSQNAWRPEWRNPPRPNRGHLEMPDLDPDEGVQETLA